MHETISGKQHRKAEKQVATKYGYTSQTKLGLYEKKLIRNVKMKVYHNKINISKAEELNTLLIIIYKIDYYMKIILLFSCNSLFCKFTNTKITLENWYL
jgi:hypothetical protein